jgi:hypothetical protein
MADETLIAAAEPDRFTHESPIRAFTEFRVSGTWAIGKGFRPSLAHLHTYLDAMQGKEGWHLVQIIDGASLDPTLVFQRDRVMSFTVPNRHYKVEGPKKPLTMEEIDEHFRSIGFALISTPEGNLRYEPERKIGKHPALGAPYTPSEDTTPAWMQHASDEPIPDDHYMKAAEYVIRRVLAGKTPDYVEPTIRDFKKRFEPPKNHRQIDRTSLFQQLEFVMHGKTTPLRLKQLIDAYREENRHRYREPYQDFAKSVMDSPEMQPIILNAALHAFIDDVDPASRDVDGFGDPAMPDPRVPNIGDDPINPAYYDWTACAEIIEHMPTNVGIAAKYVWRLGEKDAEKQECGKAAWYLKRELALYDDTVVIGPGRAKFGFATPGDCQWYRSYADRRIDAARTAGKLNPERALCLTHLVSYTITGHPSLLHQAIAFLESRECFSEYGRGLEP